MVTVTTVPSASSIVPSTFTNSGLSSAGLDWSIAVIFVSTGVAVVSVAGVIFSGFCSVSVVLLPALSSVVTEIGLLGSTTPAGIETLPFSSTFTSSGLFETSLPSSLRVSVVS
ncbi:hypothetical protein HS327_01264 [Glaesserella parasuis]|nr:hypothetical protein HS327_01264 [Glaesserella parasuis]